MNSLFLHRFKGQLIALLLKRPMTQSCEKIQASIHHLINIINHGYNPKKSRQRTERKINRSITGALHFVHPRSSPSASIYTGPLPILRHTSWPSPQQSPNQVVSDEQNLMCRITLREFCHMSIKLELGLTDYAYNRLRLSLTVQSLV